MTTMERSVVWVFRVRLGDFQNINWYPFDLFGSNPTTPVARQPSLDDMNLDQFLKISNYEDTVKQLDIYYGIGELLGLHGSVATKIHFRFHFRLASDWFVLDWKLNINRRIQQPVFIRFSEATAVAVSESNHRLVPGLEYRSGGGKHPW